MKVFLLLSAFFYFISCGTDDQPAGGADHKLAGAPTVVDVAFSKQNKEYKYKVSCKCRGLGDEPVRGGSNENENTAKLIAGSLCALVLQPNKEIALKAQEGRATEEEKQQMQTLIKETLQKALTGDVDNSVLSAIYDCKTE